MRRAAVDAAAPAGAVLLEVNPSRTGSRAAPERLHVTAALAVIVGALGIGCGGGGASSPEARRPASVLLPRAGDVAPRSPTIAFCGRDVPLDATDLACTRRDVTDLAPLRSLTKLESLVLTFAPVSDLTPVTDLPALKVLVVLFSNVTDVAPLAKVTQLEALALSFSPVSDVTALGKLPHLVQLDLNGTKVVDLSPIAALPRLEKLDLRETRVLDLGPLSTILTLRRLDLGGTNLSADAVSTFRARSPDVVVVGP